MAMTTASMGITRRFNVGVQARHERFLERMKAAGYNYREAFLMALDHYERCPQKGAESLPYLPPDEADTADLAYASA